MSWLNILTACINIIIIITEKTYYAPCVVEDEAKIDLVILR